MKNSEPTQPEAELDLRRRRALYRAQHRGTKEMDWLLGRYASSALPVMQAHELATFERLLSLPDPDLEHWIRFAPGAAPGAEIAEMIFKLRRFHGLDPS